MQRIMTKEEIEKKQNRNKIIIGIVLVGLMVLSSAGYAIFQSSGTNAKVVTYNKIKFTLEDDGYWHFSVNNQDYLIRTNPNDVSNISASVSFSAGSYSGKELYFSYDSNRDATDEINRNIGRFASRIQYACVGQCDQDLPVKNCSVDNIIIVRDINSTSLIKQEDNCVYISASPEDSVRASDKFIFSLLRI